MWRKAGDLSGLRWLHRPRSIFSKPFQRKGAKKRKESLAFSLRLCVFALRVLHFHHRDKNG
jgi:5-methylcytosine-specific restriction endonuclease McrA